MDDLFSGAEEVGGPVTVFGRTFSSDLERRKYFTERLAEKLKDPSFRSRDGFPEATDEAIIRLSDPPFYTACPNPFLEEFLSAYGNNDFSSDGYRRLPFVADVSAAKTDHLYKSHRYHTKVPYKAIAQYILHYTKPGDIVLDGFCGTGMTGVAAGYLSNPDAEFMSAVGLDRGSNSIGARHALMVDLSPAASSLAAAFNMPVDAHAFLGWAKKTLAALEAEIGWMYRCDHAGQAGVGLVTEYVWSEVFSCPECGGEIDFMKHCCADDASPLDEFACPHCHAELSKSKLEKRNESFLDRYSGQEVSRPTRRLARIHYKVGKSSYVRTPTDADLELIRRTENVAATPALPTMVLPYMHMTHERARMDKQGITHYHHFFTDRTQVVLSKLWSAADEARREDVRHLARFWIDSHFLNLSIQNCYRPGVSFPYNPINGIYYVSSLVSEPNPFIAYENKLKQILRGFGDRSTREGGFAVMTGSCASIPVPENSVDYIFTDPPFGENIYYSDLNFLVEAWSRVLTNPKTEAIIDRARNKALPDYQHLMLRCFSEYFRVLKPGRWMTVVFSNSKAAVWNAIQVALQQAGFVVAEVTALDKVQGSYRQVTSTTAVKQDLVISAYKPDGDLEERLALKGATPESAWDFVQSHLAQLSVVKVRDGELEFIVERDPRRIYDRLIAWFIRHDAPVPLSSDEFLSGLRSRFPERDGMVFLPDQVAAYDRKRAQVTKSPQMDLFVSDERSAIDWLSDFLKSKPSTYQELHPDFITQVGAGWKKHEAKPELSALLENNFLKYDGTDEVPSQIHTYLSSNYREFRGLEKSDPALRAKAQDRWFVPDPNKAQDLEKKREKALLKEFDGYVAATGRKLKEFRLEVLRAGFKTAWASRDYQTIIKVAQKIPEEALQEDEKLLLWYDQALTRVEDRV